MSVLAAENCNSLSFSPVVNIIYSSFPFIYCCTCTLIWYQYTIVFTTLIWYQYTIVFTTLIWYQYTIVFTIKKGYQK